MTRRIMRSSLLAALLAGTVILTAQQAPPQQFDDDGYAPDHGVARISLVNGDVSVRRGDTNDLTAAVPNGPVVANDSVATGPGARAEVQFDWGNMIRLAPETEVRLGELEDRRYLVQIAIGTTTFRVLRDSNADVEISTPTVSVRPLEQGSYRVTVLPDGTTEITVRTGRAEIFSPRGTEMLTAGRTMEARGTPSDPEYMILAAIPQDEWDRFNVDRDRVMESTSSYRYVSPDVVGAEELDQNGRWANDPEYGNVWVPSVDAGWAPYRNGRWVDEPYYGWTWVSGDPFGWAPYHYGNWYMSSNFGWAWYPGPIGGRHYWRPAMVGFFGWGSGGGIGFGFGNVGWVPLAPYERYRPWYGRGFNNRGNTIIVNNVSVVNNYRNARFVNGRNGVTSINANDFGRGRSINTNNFVRASSNDLVRTGSVQGRLPFNASAESRRMSDRQVNTQSLPRVNANTRFAQRSGQGRANNNISNNVNNNLNNNSGGGFRRFDNGAAPNDNRGQRSVQGAPQVQGNPAPQVNRGQVDRGSNGNGSGWRRFDTGAPSNPGNSNRGQSNPGQINRGPVVDRGNSNGGGRRFEAPTPSVAPVDPGNGNRGQFNPSQVNPGQINRGPVNRGNSNGGGRRFEPPAQNAPAPQVRSYPQPQQRPAAQPQEQRQFRQSMPQQQPVRISPPIVRERGPAPQVSRPEPPRGGFGTARPQGGGEQRGNGGGNRSESRGNGNGGDRGNGGGRRR